MSTKSHENRPSSSNPGGDHVIWKVRLAGVQFGAIPSFSTRPNPVVANEKLIASAFAPGCVVAVDRNDGTELWRSPIRPYAGESILVAHRRVLAKSPNTLFALRLDDGQVDWSFSPHGPKGETLYAGPTVDNGRVFIGDRQREFRCLAVDTGDCLWSFRIPEAERGEINATALALDNKVFVATNAGVALALDQFSGRLIWSQVVGGPSIHQLRSWHEKVMVQTGRSLVALRPSDGEIVATFDWPDWRIRAWAQVSGVTVAVVERLPESTMPPAEPERQIVGFTSGRTLYRRRYEGDFSGLRSSDVTGLLYESRVDGFGVIDPHSGARVHDVAVPCSELPRPGIADVRDGIIYLLTGNGILCALRHP